MTGPQHRRHRDARGAVDVMGLATNAVTVAGLTPYRKGEYFRKEVPVDSSSSAVWQSINVSAPNETAVNGYQFVPKTAETFVYDLDGNLTSDGRWNYTWDLAREIRPGGGAARNRRCGIARKVVDSCRSISRAEENRLTSVVSLSSAPTASKREVFWAFHGQGRRIRQATYDGSSGSYVLTEDIKFLSDGWRHIAELNASDNSVLRTYVWGLDLSGSLENEWGRSLVLTSFIGSANGKEVAHWTRASNKKKAPVTISRLCVSAFNSCPGGVAIYP
jgi:hypothetical protein